MSIPLCEQGKCIHLLKYYKCNISNKRCNINHEYNYNTKNWKVYCREFENVNCKICKKEDNCNLK